MFLWGVAMYLRMLCDLREIRNRARIAVSHLDEEGIRPELGWVRNRNSCSAEPYVSMLCGACYSNNHWIPHHLA